MHMNGTNRRKHYESVSEYVTANGLRKGWQAAQWGITPSQMSALLYPGRYRIALTPEQWSKIARTLRRSVAEVRSAYEVAA